MLKGFHCRAHIRLAQQQINIFTYIYSPKKESIHLYFYSYLLNLMIKHYY